MRIGAGAADRSKDMNPHILIAEDDPTIRSLITDLLTFDGYDVSAAKDGAEALNALRSGTTSLAILDVMMPEADGLTVLRELREMENGSDMPVILLTAKADDESTWEGWRAGCNLYLSKPFEPDDLLVAVDRLLKESA